MKTFPNSCQVVCKWSTTKIPVFICEVTLKKPFENKPIRALTFITVQFGQSRITCRHT